MGPVAWPTGVLDGVSEGGQKQLRAPAGVGVSMPPVSWGFADKDLLCTRDIGGGLLGSRG